MASQCRILSVHSSTSRLFVPHSCSTPASTTSGNLRVHQVSVFFRGQRLQSQRLSQPSLSKSSRPLVQCVSSTFGGSLNNNGEESQQSSVISNVVEPIRAFPWGKAGSLFRKRVVDQFWTVGKWLAIPMLAVSVLGELVYTLVQESVLVIPVGMISGIFFAGVIKETALELSPGIEKEQTPWHLVALGLLFVALKVVAPHFPNWGRVSVPHFANGGLWQVITFVNDWREKHANRKTVEQS